MTTNTETIPEYPEPQGYCNEPGFVKANPKNNKTYLNKVNTAYAEYGCPELGPILFTLDEAIEAFAPGYNIAQIKEKFWDLRYYYDLPAGTEPEVQEQVRQLVRQAELDAAPVFQKMRVKAEEEMRERMKEYGLDEEEDDDE